MRFNDATIEMAICCMKGWKVSSCNAYNCLVYCEMYLYGSGYRIYKLIGLGI